MKNHVKKLVGSLFQRVSPTATLPDASPLLALVDPKDLLPQQALARLGTKYGGWIIPADAALGPDSICYLAGAGEDISFDCALVKQFGCKARIVDPTPRAIEHFHQLSEAVLAGNRFPVNNSTTDFYELTPEQLARLTFLPVGLASKDVELKFYMPKDPSHVSCSTANLQKTDNYFVAQCHRLSTLMAQQGDTHIDLMKMDIEGGEYDVISDLASAGPLPRILLIEFDETHAPQDAGALGRIGKHIQMLVDAGMRCIAAEGSNITLVRKTDAVHG